MRDFLSDITHRFCVDGYPATVIANNTDEAWAAIRQHNPNSLITLENVTEVWAQEAAADAAGKLIRDRAILYLETDYNAGHPLCACCISSVDDAVDVLRDPYTIMRLDALQRIADWRKEGKLPWHSFKVVRALCGEYIRVECMKPDGWMRASGPLPEDGICFSCKESIFS